MALRSKFFTSDPVVKTRLDRCLHNDSDHILFGARGPHVSKIQAALFVILPDLHLPDNELSDKTTKEGFYGPATAAAVLLYKQNHKPPILNESLHQKTPDPIVGKRTIQFLDDDLFAKESGPTPPPVPPPVVTNIKTIEVTAKSFIAFIGTHVGFIPGITVLPPIVPGTPIPIPMPRQTLLEALARLTDAQFNENPLNSARDRLYRLFSSCRFRVVWENGKILGATPSILDTDVGKEGPLQPDPLITSPVTVSPTGGSFVKFSWTGKGRPQHPVAEQSFQTVQSRNSVFIWHVIDGQIDVSSGVPITTVALRGSQFPSHRVFVDGKLIFPQLRQGPFSSLWVSDPIDKTKVK